MSFLSIRGNALGLMMFVAGGVIAGVGSFVLRLGDVPVMLMVGVALITMDLLFRVRVRPAPGWLMQPQFGGFLLFVPVWIAGLAVIGINIVNSLMP